MHISDLNPFMQRTFKKQQCGPRSNSNKQAAEGRKQIQVRRYADRILLPADYIIGLVVYKLIVVKGLYSYKTKL
jgi:hypothetical protein